jgi:transcriptional regulator with XRE-family HTH domain
MLDNVIIQQYKTLMIFNHQKLIDLRWSKRLKQTELANLVGVKPPIISNWEKGKYIPSSPLLMRLAAALDVEPSYFFE